ncbi:retinitis pigmentosa 1-like 1 protein [Amphibalanus amphitrite]|uniref:retinitis pigmentosa 1-like 1 protein n=1 Tax=Amphibalanus amphitrite TaxID=1232801 RepID=UPI001C9267B4|nr:retinitis pigmentosa 1-like 1 protein [Amphibalanus amphitrite]
MRRVLVLLSLLLTSSCLPADPLTSEGSGHDVTLGEVDVLSPEPDDVEEAGERDELLTSLADLLERMQTLRPKSPGELKPGPGLDPELGPGSESQPESGAGIGTGQEREAEPKQELKTEPENVASDEADEDAEQEESQADPDTNESEEVPTQSEEQEQPGTERPDIETTTVLTVQLLDVPVESEPGVPAAVDSEPAEPQSEEPEPAQLETVTPEKESAQPVVPQPDVSEDEVPTIREPESIDESPESIDESPEEIDESPESIEESLESIGESPESIDESPEEIDVPLGQNEVPLPSPARTPVQEPLIIAETAACVGCVTPILQDGADLRRVSNMAAKLLEEELDSQHTFRVMEVYRASKQVVNGIKYFLTLEVAPTSCERPLTPFTLCFVASDAERLLYAVELLHQPHRANTELLHLRKLDRSEIAGFGGLFAAATAEPATEATPHRKAAPIAPGDSLLDILMGLDSVISKQREREEAEGAAEPAPPAPPADRQGPPPLQMDPPGPPAARPGPPPLLQAARPDPPPLQADPALQTEPALSADWQAEIQQRHSASQQSLRVQALLREAGWPGVGVAPRRRTRPDSGHTQEEGEETRCREGRQYSTPHVPLNVAHPRVQKILHKFLERQESVGSNRLVITDIQSATQQTISETNYRFDFVLGVSECPTNSTAHRYSCSATSAHPLSNCRVRARHRPGKPLQFNTVSCTTAMTPQCANGHCQVTEIHPYAPLYVRPPQATVEVDIHDPTYQQLVQHVQSEVNRRSRRPLLKKFVKTLNATKVSYNLEESSEIIDQELYSLTLRFAETGCARTDDPDLRESCLQGWQPAAGAASSSGGHPSSVCDVRVSSLGWADRMRVLDLFCETELAPEAA